MGPGEYLKIFSDAGYKVHTKWFDSSAGETIKPHGIRNVFVLDPSNPQNVVVATRRSEEYLKQRHVLHTRTLLTILWNKRCLVDTTSHYNARLAAERTSCFTFILR